MKQSEKTFKNEFEILLNEIPEALWREDEYMISCANYYDAVYNPNRPDSFDDSNLINPPRKFLGDRDDLSLMLGNLPAYLDEVRKEKLEHMGHLDTLFNRYFGISIKRSVEFLKQNPVNILNRIATDSSNAFMVYLPMHKYFRNRQTPWGIHIFWKEFTAWVLYTYERFKPDYAIATWFNVLLCSAYRAALFNFHVERFSTKLEIINRKPYYKPYKLEVYDQTLNTPDCLEDALKQASILTSVLVTNLTRTGIKKLRYEYQKLLDAKIFPPGESDYHCKQFGGAPNGYLRLTEQIIKGEIDTKPFHVTGMINVREEYSTSDTEAPVYIMLENKMLEKVQ